MQPMQSNSISVIIPSYNAGKTIGRTLEALANLTSPEILRDIVVVDSSDDDRTRAVIDNCQLKNLKKIYFHGKRSPAEARNAGARIASGQVLAFVDADAYPDASWIQQVEAAILRGYRVGGGSIELPPEQRANPVAVAQYFLQFNEFMPESAEAEKPFSPSCNLFCEKALFLEVGGFPPIRASEDVLFGLAVSAKEKYHFIPAMKVFHIFNDRLRRLCENQVLLGTYNILYRKQHYGGFYRHRLLTFFLAPVFAAIKGARIFRRVFSSGGPRMRQFIGVAPFFLAGLIFCGIGFAKGAWLSPVTEKAKQ